MRIASLTLIHSTVGLVLLIAAALLPVAGWHRLYLRRPGWWLMPLVYSASAGTIAIVALAPLARPWVLLVAAAPLAVLWVAECHLILRSAPALARKQVALDKREAVEV
ncbi:MAG: hypothetical protein NVV60_05740 [Luteimonas sp.]|nr:hypothetical protein [Luteimonas sp.]